MVSYKSYCGPAIIGWAKNINKNKTRFLASHWRSSLANWQIYRSGKLTDKQVTSLLDDLEAKWGRRKSLVYLAGGAATSYDATTVSAAIGKKNRELISQASYYPAPPSKFELQFRRGTGNVIDNPDAERSASPYFDELWLKLTDPTPDNPSLPAGELAELLDTVRKYVSFDRPPNQDGLAVGATELLQAQFTQLNALFSEMISDVEARRVQLENEIGARRAALEEERHALHVELELEGTESRRRLSEQSAQLEERSRALDDRDHMHARRQLRERITTDIQGRLARSLVPRAAGVMRWTVLALAMLGVSLCGYSAVMNIGEFGSLVSAIVSSQKYSTIYDWANNIPLWILLVKGTLSSALALAFLVYAISWLRQLYHQDVKAHREFERYSYDIDRASWAIETIMEATSKEGVQLPDSWIAGVTRNLFEAPVQRDHDASNEALAALLNSTAKAEIGPGGAVFELNGRGAKKLAKELEEK